MTNISVKIKVLDDLIMYVGLFCHSAVAFNVFLMFFSCFYVLRTVCVVVFFSVTLLIYSAVGL